jgi:hypothetical protein
MRHSRIKVRANRSLRKAPDIPAAARTIEVIDVDDLNVIRRCGQPASNGAFSRSTGTIHTHEKVAVFTRLALQLLGKRRIIENVGRHST